MKVTPALNGRWRWIGTRTLRFEFTGAVDRLPMATSYTRRGSGGHRVADRAQARDRGRVDVPHATAEGADVRARRTRRSTRRRSSSRPSISASIPDAVIKTITLDGVRNQGRDPPRDRRRDHRRRSGAPDLAGHARRPLGRLPAGVPLAERSRAHDLDRARALPRPRDREPRRPRRPTRPPRTRRSRSRASSAATATVAGRDPASPSRSTTPSTRSRSTRAA